MAEKTERVFPKGVFAFKPHEKAPSFVKASVVITLEDLREFVNGDGKQYLTDYNGKKQLKLQITENKNDGKFSMTVDTYRKEDSPAETYPKARIEPLDDNSQQDDGLPF